jgi:hypothetical protein
LVRFTKPVGSCLPEHCAYTLCLWEQAREQVLVEQAGHRYLGGCALQRGHRSDKLDSGGENSPAIVGML